MKMLQTPWPILVVCTVLMASFGCGKQVGPDAAAIPPKDKPLAAEPGKKPSTLLDLTVKRLDGTDVLLSSFAGKVLLVVNTASECGYTPQYEGLEALHAKNASRGFAVLGFPSNDFGGQEPGTAVEIASFCKLRYGVTFPLFAKVNTKGADRSPLYALLTDAKGEPKWNFHKYLIDKKGIPVEVWPSAVNPLSPEIAEAITRELSKP